MTVKVIPSNTGWERSPMRASQLVDPIPDIQSHKDPQLARSSSQELGRTRAIQAQRPKKIVSIAGFLYLFWTMACGIGYLIILSECKMSDFWWRGFNVSGSQRFVADAYNSRLMAAPAEEYTFSLMDASSFSLESYASESTIIKINPSYARQLLLANISFTVVVTNLRQLPFESILSINSPFCWLDFNRSMEVALTSKRQARCAIKEKENAAAYVEAFFRNQKFETWVKSKYWDQLFKAFFNREESQVWAVKMNKRTWGSISEEVAEWQSYGLTTWQTQLQNANQEGIRNTLFLFNAFGLEEAVTTIDVPLKPRSAASWTTYYAYNGLWNVLARCKASNCSLIRGNESQDSMWDLESDDDGEAHFEHIVPRLNHVHLGPYGSIDIKLIRHPKALQTYALTFKSDFFTHRLASDPAMEGVWNPVPPHWRHPKEPWVYYSGNPLCFEDEEKYTAQDSFGVDDDCALDRPLAIAYNAESLWFAIVNANMPTSSIIADICALCTTIQVKDCTAQMMSVVSSVKRNATMTWDKAPLEVLSLNISMIQYARHLNATFLTQEMLEPNHPWAVFGWITIWDWLAGFREVYSFEGDEGSINLMTRRHDFIPMDLSVLEVPVKACQIIWYSMVYFTAVTASLALIMTIYGITIRFQALGRNLMNFNRIVGAVWTGRTFMFLRGMTAIVIMSTTSMRLVREDHTTKMLSSYRHVVENMIIVGEATWLTYAINDFFLPCTQDLSRLYAPLSSALAWAVMFKWQVFSPYEPSMTLQRNCTIVTLGYQLECTSGVLEIGSIQHMSHIVLLNLICVATAFVVVTIGTVLVRRIRKQQSSRNLLVAAACDIFVAAPISIKQEGSPHLLLAAACQSFMRAPTDSKFWYLDKVSCVMAGLIPLGKLLFDMKLWYTMEEKSANTIGYILEASDFTYRGKKGGNDPAPFTRSPTSRVIFVRCIQRYFRSMRIRAIAGVFYIIVSISVSYSYLNLSIDAMQNSFWWSGFNSTGHQTYLANWFNKRLQMTHRDLNSTWDESRYSDDTKAHSVYTIQDTSSFYANQIQDEVNTLENVIQGLRTMDGCQLPWIFTAYCWLDFDKRWEVAYSEKRQQRCQSRESQNGAKYLEGLFRNANWEQLNSCWKGSIDIAYVAFLQSSVEGTQWWQAVQSNPLSVHDEVAFWERHDITHYTTEWQNFKQLGVIETFSVENAHAISSMLTLKKSNGSLRMATQTSMHLYWGLAYDLSSVILNGTSTMSGQSLIRQSPQFAFRNVSLITAMIENQTLASPMGVAFSTFETVIGPFGSVDATRVPPSPGLRQLYRQYADALSALLYTNESAQTFYDRIRGPEIFYIRPTSWSNIKNVSNFSYYDGSLLCEATHKNDYHLNPYFASAGACQRDSIEHLRYKKVTVVYALMATGMALSPPAAMPMARVCACETQNTELCLNMLYETLTFLRIYFSESKLQAFHESAQPAKAFVKDTLMIEFTQFMHDNENDTSVFGRVNVFEEQNMEWFSWMYIFSWAWDGMAEVLTFQGDVGNITSISCIIDAEFQSANEKEIPKRLVSYIRASLMYMTVVLCTVSCMVLGYVIATQGSVEGLNIFEFNRVAGIVWLGRPLLILRGIVAISFLSTASFNMTMSGFMLSMSTPFTFKSAINTFLSANEMGWLVYIINDVFSVVTRQYTKSTSLKSNIVAAFIAGTWSLASPVEPFITIDRSCSVVVVDFQVVCASGTLKIGSFDRFCGLIGVAFGSCFISYVITRWMQPNMRYESTGLKSSNSLLLSSVGLDNFEKDSWETDSVYYVDKASAMMNGAISFEFRGLLLIFDIKMWRLYTLERSSYPIPALQAWQRAIPLMKNNRVTTSVVVEA